MTKKITASHILCATNNVGKEEALGIITELKEKLEEGEGFADLAKEHSDCPSGSKGGDLGEFGRGAMVSEFEEVAFNLKKGEFSDIVETDFGYHLIQRTG